MLRLTLLARRVSWRDESGAIAVIVALTMVVVLGMAALVIDVGALQAKKAQLQEASDAAALALAQSCVAASGTTTAACSGAVTSTALATATQLALANVNDNQVTVGVPVFTASTVKVTTTSTEQGWFSQVFGVESSGVVATATAKWSPPVTPLPLAYQECALPAPSSTTKVLLRTDALKVLNLFDTSCGLLSGVVGVLGASWAGDSTCSFDVNLLTYVGGVLSNVLPANCVSTVTSLIGKQVVLPVYDRVLVPIVVNGVLLGNGYRVEKYALVTVTGYDFQSLNLLGISLGGPKSISGSPQCPSVLGIEEPLCQGLQGYLEGYLTPDEAAQRLGGVQLIE